MNWLLYAILGAIFSGLSPVLAKSGIHKSNAHLGAALRGTFLFLSAVFILKQTGTGAALLEIGQTTFLYLLFSGIATGVAWVCLLRALQSGEVVKIIPIIEGSMVLIILVNTIFFHEGWNWNKIIIVLMLTVGICMMGYKGFGRGRKAGAWLGYAAGTMVLVTMIMLFEKVGYSGLRTSEERVVRYGIALAVVWIVTFAVKGYKALRTMSFLNGVYLCLSGVVMGAAWYCFHQAYTLGASADVVWIEKFDLVAAVVFGCVFLRERLAIRGILGMFLIMLGFWLMEANLPIIPL